jgi:chaperone modulatory protein CbpM
MSNQHTPAHVPSELLDPETVCSLDEVCSACKVEAEWIVELVQHGAIEPIGRDQPEWRFTSITIARVAKARRLERDLGLNPPGIALALELLDEIRELRHQLSR